MSQSSFTLHEKKKVTEEILSIPYTEYEYPFENLVFEGGGIKGISYTGCVQVLEEAGIKPKRVAGSSAGAIGAALLAAGFRADELSRIVTAEFLNDFTDHRCGLCSLLPNLLDYFGWYPGNKFMEHLGDCMKEKLGDPDVTFLQLYKKTGVELCVTAFNVNMASVEYFHPKTSPNMSVRLAVRMSISIPGVFQAVKYPNSRGDDNYYIDGGVVCNYPIHAFDGWWLSMKQDDSFLNKIQPLRDIQKLMDHEERFGSHNNKTMGFIMYTETEQDIFKSELENRVGAGMPEHLPDSTMSRKSADCVHLKEEAHHEHEVFLGAMEKFLKALKCISRDSCIDRQELRLVLQKAMDFKDKHSDNDVSTEFGRECADLLTADDITILFGENVKIDTLFDELDADNSEYIMYDELLNFIGRSGIDIQEKFLGYDRMEIYNLRDFVSGVVSGILTSSKRAYIEHKDVYRTVGIHSGSVGVTDFDVNDADADFLIQQGRNATIAFLRDYVCRNNPKRKVQDTGPVVNHIAPVLEKTATVSLPDDDADSSSEQVSTPLLTVATKVNGYAAVSATKQ